MRTAIKRQLDCSRALCLACADLGNACAEAEVRDVQFQNAQYQLDDDIRKNLDDSIVKALESLENKLQPFAELEKMVLNRNKLKLDYDYYARKVRPLSRPLPPCLWSPFPSHPSPRLCPRSPPGARYTCHDSGLSAPAHLSLLS